MARPREFDEEDVVARAMHVFWTKGYDATSVQDLVDATGLKRGSLYGAFGDKRGLFLTAFGNYADGGLRRLKQAIDGHDDPVAGVIAFVGLVAAQSKLAANGQGCMVAKACGEMAGRDPQVKALIDAHNEAVIEAMADAFERGVGRGSFASGRDPRAAAAHVHCTLQGMAMLGAAHTPDARIDEITTELVAAIGRGAKQ